MTTSESGEASPQEHRDEQGRDVAGHSQRRFRIWISAGAVLLIVLILAVVVWHRGRPRPVRIAVMTWAGAGPGFVGIEKGFFDGLPVEITVIDDTKARQAAYNSEDFDVYLTNPDQHPLEVERQLPGTMFLLSDVSMGADGLIAKPDIRTIADLSGKRIAYTQGTASDYMLSKALTSAGLTRNDVKLITLDDPSSASAALASGEVDAAVSWEPLMSQAVKEGKARILFTSADVPDTIIGVFIAKDSLITDPARRDRLMNGWLRAVDYTKTNPEDAYGIMSRNFKVSRDEIRGMMSGLRLADRKKNHEYFTRGDNGLTKLDVFTNDAAANWHRVGVLKQEPEPAHHWVRNEPVQFFASP